MKDSTREPGYYRVKVGSDWHIVLFTEKGWETGVGKNAYCQDSFFHLICENRVSAEPVLEKKLYRWVKASEKLPPEKVQVIIRDGENVYSDKTEAGWNPLATDYEWLEEITKEIEPSPLVKIINQRIQQLNSADAAFCKDRWNMELDKFRRMLAREESNKVTFARQELEQILIQIPPSNNKKEDEQEKFGSDFIERIVEEFKNNHGIDTDLWEYKYGDCCDSAIEFLARAFKDAAAPSALPVVSDEGWIDVNDRLPEIDPKNKRTSDSVIVEVKSNEDSAGIYKAYLHSGMWTEESGAFAEQYGTKIIQWRYIQSIK